MLQKCVFGCVSPVTHESNCVHRQLLTLGCLCHLFPVVRLESAAPAAPPHVAKGGNYYKHGQLATDSYTQARKNER